MKGDQKIGPVKFLSVHRTFFFLILRMTDVLHFIIEENEVQSCLVSYTVMLNNLV